VAALTMFVAACSAEGDQPPATTGSPRVTESTLPAPEQPVWRKRTGIDTPRDDFASAVVDGEIWAFGGMTGARGTRLRSSEIYDTRTDTWRYGPDVPEGLASFEAAAVGDDIYVFGGLDERTRASDFSAVLDTTTRRWTALPPLPHVRYAHDVDVLDGKVYVMGGEAGGRYVAAVDVFDPVAGTWSRAADMIQPRASLDMVPVGQVIYVLGGWDVSEPTDRMQVYDPAADRWTESTPLPQPMSRGGAAEADGRIWVSLHEWSAVFDPVTAKWSPANPMTVSRHGLGYIAVGPRIYGIGGCTETPLRDVSFVDVLKVSG
jgi:N-acetylneuraminic acid mutarotase